MERFTTPVIFIIYNRPDLTERVFAAIREVKPVKLLVVADGPKRTEDKGKCLQARDVLKRVDWDCAVLTNYSDENLGCKRRVSSGIDWAFTLVEEAIILEDDCLPDPTFFTFCQAMLDKYRDDERIMHITGGNFQFGNQRNEFSYYFSRLIHIWGWATWRRAWRHYDVAMDNWPAIKKANMFSFGDERQKTYWTDLFDLAYENKVDTWDYQWVFACFSQSALSIIPNVNLITNIGFREDGTHTKDADSIFSNMRSGSLEKLEHPNIVLADAQADLFSYEQMLPKPSSKSIVGEIRSKISRFIKN